MLLRRNYFRHKSIKNKKLTALNSKWPYNNIIGYDSFTKQNHFLQPPRQGFHNYIRMAAHDEEGFPIDDFSGSRNGR